MRQRPTSHEARRTQSRLATAQSASVVQLRHAPSMHDVDALQVVRHVPQCAGSTEVATQPPAQQRPAAPVARVHAESSGTGDDVQPIAPQASAVHALASSAHGAPATQRPIESHTSPVVHGSPSSQATPLPAGISAQLVPAQYATPHVPCGQRAGSQPAPESPASAGGTPVSGPGGGGGGASPSIPAESTAWTIPSSAASDRPARASRAASLGASNDNVQPAVITIIETSDHPSLGPTPTHVRGASRPSARADTSGPFPPLGLNRTEPPPTHGTRATVVAWRGVGRTKRARRYGPCL